MTALHILTVTNPDDGKALRLFFTSYEAYYDAKRDLSRLGYKLDGSPGCQVFTKARDALETVEAFIPRN